MTDLRYPIGLFQKPESLNADQIRSGIQVIAETPAKLRMAVAGLSDARLDTPYRPEGWTVRQVVHHVPDSHLNCYIRFKLGLTEESPTIKPYAEHLWAALADSRGPVETPLRLLDLVHDKLVAVLNAIAPGEWGRTIVHPESGILRLDQLLALYAWHGPHHVAHVRALRERNGW